MPDVTVAHPVSYAPERAYILDVLLGELLGLAYSARAEPRDDVRISIPGTAGSVTLVDGLFALREEDWLRHAALPRTPLARADPRGFGLDALTGGPLPVLYGDPGRDGGWVRRAPDGGLALGVDVLGGAFFLLTRFEEVVEPTADAHGRFPADASLAHREGFLDRPLVNEYGELLWSALSAVWPRLRRRPRRYRVLVSHDVDHPVAPWRGWRGAARSAAGDLARRRDPVLAVRRARAAVARRAGRLAPDVLNTFDFLMDVSEARGCRSAFYLMASPGRAGLDGGYDLRDPFVARLLQRIHGRGHEIGLHPTYDTFGHPGAVAAQFRALTAACHGLGIDQDGWGGRQHFLRFEAQATWRAWDEAGLAYDSSVGFAGAPGFRAGACFEYPTFDLLRRQSLRLRERPLVVMEGTLFDHLALSREAAAETVLGLAAVCRRFGGDFTLLWHNSTLAGGRDRLLYRELVGAL